MTVGPLQITSEEVNCLIYAYFKDSGFSHSAFSVLHEAQLHRSPYLSKHIPRGELIQLLGKALLYLEVESHWRGDSMTNDCQTGFSLLEPHICSSISPDSANMHGQQQQSATHATQPISSVSAHSQLPRPTQNTNGTPLPPPGPSTIADANTLKTAQPHTYAVTDSNNKRKVSPVPSSAPQEKRARRDPDEMDVDSRPAAPAASTSKTTNSTPTPSVSSQTQSRKSGNAKPRRPQGPGDDKTDPRSILLLPGHKSEVFVCAFNPVHYEVLGTGSKDAVVNLWKLPKPPQRVDAFTTSALPPVSLQNLSTSTQADLTALHWSPDGNLLAIGSYDSVFRICTRKGTMYFTHSLHEGPIFAVRFSKNGRWVLTASLDGTAAVWDVNERKLHRQYSAHKDCCLDIEWLSDDTFASAGADKRINIIKIHQAEPIKLLEGHKDEINQIRVNPSRTRLGSCSDDTTARIWRVDNISSTADAIPGLASSDDVVVLQGHTHSVSTIAWCPMTPTGTHELVATASFDSTARLWDSVTGQCLHVFTDHTKPVYAMAFSPNGNFLATGAGDGWFNIYSVKAPYERVWSWYAGYEKPGVFEIDWQTHDGVNRIALALEGRQVAVIDVSKLAALDTVEYRNGLLAIQSTAPGLLSQP
ncbi:WD-repeat-containing protein [Coprinopsis cinerea AmutBmut pab1-1]|nr:WD-repeat-containing protein [Coprinopsis cinerea AmutBmut pab1-1]